MHMARIYAENVFWAWGQNFDGQLFSQTWEINMPPSNVLVKVFLSQFFGLGDFPLADAGMVSARHRQPDGSDMPISFPDIDLVSFINQSYYDDHLTSFTMGLNVINCHARMMCVAEFWE